MTSTRREFIQDGSALVAASGHISRHITLKPGDLIFTGTPEGVIAGYPPDKQRCCNLATRLPAV